MDGVRSQGSASRRNGALPKHLLLVLAAGALTLYLAFGLGYHRMAQACHETRHADDPELDGFDGPVGVVIDTTAWPVFQLANAWNGVSCGTAAEEP